MCIRDSNYKVREHSLSKTPVIIALGKREVEERTVSVRRLGQKKQVVMTLSDAVTLLAEESDSRASPNSDSST